ncbi:MAG TPA: phosphoribosylaminoimidazolesuccinocarboxamide synthase [Pyrinomonadaceae bacterium]|nr:phosphoribosylaminoimidazolesuccinocarboxamide synthase [Pyrinomonadaceae bacterium]
MMKPSTTSDSAQIDIPGMQLLHRGKVRDVFEIDPETLLLVATDRISAFDCVLPVLIPGKGEVLTKLSRFWFDRLAHLTANHLISTDLDSMSPEIQGYQWLRGRSTLVRRTTVFPVECVVRGYLEGSAWKEYEATGMICGHRLPQGMRQCDKLYAPLFTPATKAVAGHDENIGFDRFSAIVGQESAEYLRETSLRLYSAASDYAAARGIVIADTKFEFGRDKDGNILLIDEVLTPDSSRFWPAESYEPGHPQPSFDKQFVREYLETLDWDKKPPAPTLPDAVIEATAKRYHDAYRILTADS